MKVSDDTVPYFAESGKESTKLSCHGVVGFLVFPHLHLTREGIES